MSAALSDIELVIKHIKSYPNFPKPGILFRDIFSIFNNTEATKALQSLISTHCSSLKGKINVVCALESRGFLFGPQIALELQVPFVPIRKQGKLPGDVAKISFELEYGTDVFEIQSSTIPSGSKVLLVDDLLATGGSLAAACKLITSLGGTVEQCLVIMELQDLKGRSNIPSSVHSLIKL